jgi:FemAB-related protein (PEP-CTERM system-associated)
MTDVSVAHLDNADENAWDAFVRGAAEGTFFHLSGWRKVIESAFHHPTYYLVARRDGRVTGVLPLTHVKSLVFGNSLIATAFCVGGGVLAADAESEQCLLDRAAEIGRKKKVDCIELRSTGRAAAGWVERGGLYASFRRPIDPNPDVNMKAIPRKQRAVVRKALSLGLTCEEDSSADRLHDVYARSVSRLGTPVFPKRYFEALKQVFGDACDIVTVSHNGTPHASVMNFYFRDEVLPYYGGGTVEARALAANDLMYWEVMRRAAERGFRVFDFGRSKIGTGSYDFKRNWGFEPEPITYRFLPLGSSKLPDNNPLSPKFRLFVSAWQKLPLFATKMIGPLIVRSIG